MPLIVLGLDIGGANLKAATVDKRALSVPFALWKQPDRLPALLAELVARFPDAEQLAVTMTGELCDCYETKRQGVNAILDAVEFAAHGRTVRVWSVEGGFRNLAESREQFLRVAASNWHALATFAGRFAPNGDGLLIDIGSTTTDVIPLFYGIPATRGLTDFERLRTGELVYLGVRRTPVCAMISEKTAAELFATTEDVFIVLGMLPEDPTDRDTADNRLATSEYALARLARMIGGDRETLRDDEIIRFAETVHERIRERVAGAVRGSGFHTAIVSGEGEFLARQAIAGTSVQRIVSLNAELGPEVSACAPAYALAVLGTEMES